jgi:hypothetical protein
MEFEKKSKDIKSLSKFKVSNLLPLEIGGVYRWKIGEHMFNQQ